MVQMFAFLVVKKYATVFSILQSTVEDLSNRNFVYKGTVVRAKFSLNDIEGSSATPMVRHSEVVQMRPKNGQMQRVTVSILLLRLGFTGACLSHNNVQRMIHSALPCIGDVFGAFQDRR